MLATYDDAMREHQFNEGCENRDCAWILTPYDVWIKNPFYEGPPARHPQDDRDGDDECEIGSATVCNDEDIPF